MSKQNQNKGLFSFLGTETQESTSPGTETVANIINKTSNKSYKNKSQTYVRINSSNAQDFTKNLTNYFVAPRYEPEKLKTDAKDAKYIFTNESYGLPVLAESLYVSPQKSRFNLENVSAEIKEEDYSAISCPKNSRHIKELNIILNKYIEEYKESIKKFSDVKQQVVQIVSKSNQVSALDNNRVNVSKLNQSSSELFVQTSILLLKCAHYLGQGNLQETYKLVNNLNELSIKVGNEYNKYNKQTGNKTPETIQDVLYHKQREELDQTYNLISLFIAEQEKRNEENIAKLENLQKKKAEANERNKQKKTKIENLQRLLSEKQLSKTNKLIQNNTNIQKFKTEIQNLNKQISQLNQQLINDKKKTELNIEQKMKNMQTSLNQNRTKMQNELTKIEQYIRNKSKQKLNIEKNLAKKENNAKKSINSEIQRIEQELLNLQTYKNNSQNLFSLNNQLLLNGLLKKSLLRQNSANKTLLQIPNKIKIN
jgi:DNA repair exonuclease SbcCD ATPase subunit